MRAPIKCRCPTCGHPFLPADPLAILRGTQRAIFDVIYAAGQVGLTQEAIRSRVWCGRERTPESTNLISVHICKINKRLRLLRLQIVGNGKPKFYRVASMADQRELRSVA